MKISPLDKTPENIGYVWRKVWERRERYPAGDGDNMQRFLDMALAQNTLIWQLGDLGGVAMLTDIGMRGGEIRAEPHIYIWERECYGTAVEMGAFARKVMRGLGIRRLVAWTPTKADGARRYLKKMGFRAVGIMRDCIAANGQTMDVHLYDFVEEKE